MCIWLWIILFRRIPENFPCGHDFRIFNQEKTWWPSFLFVPDPSFKLRFTTLLRGLMQWHWVFDRVQRPKDSKRSIVGNLKGTEIFAAKNCSKLSRKRFKFDKCSWKIFRQTWRLKWHGPWVAKCYHLWFT